MVLVLDPSTMPAPIIDPEIERNERPKVREGLNIAIAKTRGGQGSGAITEQLLELDRSRSVLVVLRHDSWAVFWAHGLWYLDAMLLPATNSDLVRSHESLRSVAPNRGLSGTWMKPRGCSRGIDGTPHPEELIWESYVDIIMPELNQSSPARVKFTYQGKGIAVRYGGPVPRIGERVNIHWNATSHEPPEGVRQFIVQDVLYLLDDRTPGDDDAGMLVHVTLGAAPDLHWSVENDEE